MGCGALLMQNSDPMQPMRWTDYHFWLKLKCIMKWKSCGLWIGVCAMRMPVCQIRSMPAIIGHGNKSSLSFAAMNKKQTWFSGRPCAFSFFRFVVIFELVLLERKAQTQTNYTKRVSNINCVQYKCVAFSNFSLCVFHLSAFSLSQKFVFHLAAHRTSLI